MCIAHRGSGDNKQKSKHDNVYGQENKINYNYNFSHAINIEF